MKILGITVMTVLLMAVTVVIALFINHNNHLKAEADEYPPPGSIVEINDKKLHVFTEGTGDITLVFMAGHGTSNPTMDFKPLWMKLMDEYRIVVAERSGYGWSEASNSPRDIETMLEETRMTVALSGEKAPYVLFPHSLAGLEALYWAQKYPDEVIAIIGLDPCTPESIDLIPEPQAIQLKLMYFISRIGLSRLIPNSEVGEYVPVLKSNKLSQEDKNQYMAAFYKSAYTKDMLREIQYMKENADTVANNKVPGNTPMYFFISEDQEASVTGWTDALTDYLARLTVGKHLQLAAGHYVHYDKAEIIAEEAKAFLKEVKQ